MCDVTQLYVTGLILKAAAYPFEKVPCSMWHESFMWTWLNRMCDVTHSYVWRDPIIRRSHFAHTMSHVTHNWVISHMWMSHVTHMITHNHVCDISCHIIVHMIIHNNVCTMIVSHFARVNESCHTHDCVWWSDISSYTHDCVWSCVISFHIIVLGCGL